MPDGPANTPSLRDRFRHPGAQHTHPHSPHHPPRSSAIRAVGGLQNISSDDTDSLADLFLGDAPLGPTALPPARSTPPAPAQPVAAPAPQAPAPTVQHAPSGAQRVEGLLVGHLPVLAAAWVTQYAAWKAAGTSVALVRTSPQNLSVDFFGPAAASTPATSSPESAVAAARRAAVCLITTDDLAESELAGLRPIAALTLLTAANDAAVLAAYRTLRGLAWHPALAPTITEVRVCILGSPEPAARTAGDRLTKAAASFLGLPLSIEIGPTRIAPSSATPLFSGPCPLSLATLLSRFTPEPVITEVRIPAARPSQPST